MRECSLLFGESFTPPHVGNSSLSHPCPLIWRKRLANSSAPVRVTCRKDLRALSRAPKNRQHRCVHENLPRKEIGNVRRQFHRPVALASCRRRNKKSFRFFSGLERQWSFPRPMERK